MGHVRGNLHAFCLPVAIAALVAAPRLARAATCSSSESSIKSFSGATFDLQHVEGYFRIARTPGVVDVHVYRRTYKTGTNQTATFKLAVKAGGDYIEVVWTAGGTDVAINGAPLSGNSQSTPGGATVTRALLSVNTTLASGIEVSVTRVPLDPSYLDFTVKMPDAMVAQTTGGCIDLKAPVSSNEYTQLPSDLRVAATALDRAPAGGSIRYRVDVTNAGAFALNSIALAAAPGWGAATSWSCSAVGATCPAANGAGNPSGPLALSASGKLSFEVTAPVPDPIATGSVVARATAPAWTTAAATTVNEATLSWAGHYVDADGDGYGAEPMVFAAPSADLVDVGGDCDDHDPNVVPGTAACCLAAKDCDDGDACTEDTCHAGVCGHASSCVDAGPGDAGDAGTDAARPPPSDLPDAALSPAAAPADRDDDGCGCHTSSAPVGSAWLALVVAWCLKRRRR